MSNGSVACEFFGKAHTLANRMIDERDEHWMSCKQAVVKRMFIIFVLTKRELVQDNHQVQHY